MIGDAALDGVERCWSHLVVSHLSLGILVALVLAIGPAVASAQQQDGTAAARALFDEGRQLAEQEQWAEAADRFRRALALRPSPTIHYNLAACLAEIGSLLESTELLRALLLDAPPEDPVRLRAEALLRQIEPRMGRLRIRVDGPTDGVDVLVDDQPISLARVGVAVPADPGRHVVVLRSNGVEDRQEVEVSSGQTADVLLSRAPSPAAESSGQQVEVTTTSTDERQGRDRSEARQDRNGPSWPLILVGGGLVGIGVALDVAPRSTRNGELDALDLVPVALYLGGAVATALGVF